MTIVDIFKVDQIFISECKKSNTKLKSITDDKSEHREFLEENYDDIDELIEDLNKLNITYIIQELNGGENFKYNIGNGYKEISYDSATDYEDYDSKQLAKIYRELADIYDYEDNVNFSIGVDLF